MKGNNDITEMRGIMTGKNKLSYLDSGKGKTVVLIHGFCGSNAYFQKVIPLLENEYRVIAIDLPGHGKSPVNGSDFSIEDIAMLLNELLDELSLEKVMMFGHSLGGYATLAFAEAYPEKLSGFSLIHSTAYPDDETGKKGRLASIEKIKTEGIEPFVNGLVPKLFAEDNDPAIESTKQIGYGTSIEGAIESLQAMRKRPDRNAVLEQTKVPVLLVAGKGDRIISPEKVFSVKSPFIHETLLESSGHLGMLEEPEKLAFAMKHFIQSI
jgi:3-oxoadipate enol-lactonase